MQRMNKLFLVAALSFGTAAPALAAGTSYEVCLRARANCDAVIAAAIDSARHEVLYRASDSAAKPVGAALVAAKRRGVEVRAIVEASATAGRSPLVAALARNGIPVLVLGRNAAAQGSVVIIDGKDVVTGAFDFLRPGERGSADGILVMHDDPSFAAGYADRWHASERQSSPYEAAMKESAAPSGLFQAARLGDR